MPLTPTQRRDKFIEDSITTHGDKYDYSLVGPIAKLSEKVEIICKRTGDHFHQTATYHKKPASTCPCCGKTSKMTKSAFIRKANRVYGQGRYNYDHVVFPTANKKVRIICNVCKFDWDQRFADHLVGKGCLRCGGRMRKTRKQFLVEAQAVHGNKYDYANVIYAGVDTKVTIECKTHGKFEQTPYVHIRLKCGCSQCCFNKTSRPANEWLNWVRLSNPDLRTIESKEGEFRIPKTRYKADGYSKATNTVYEFHGDYWHGNPQKFDPEDVNPSVKITYGRLYKKTMVKRKIIIAKGFKYQCIWESEWKAAVKAVVQLQRAWRAKK